MSTHLSNPPTRTFIPRYEGPPSPRYELRVRNAWSEPPGSGVQ
ncbi:MAG: hypothetical protein WEA79_08915 [Balneolaceae bacterium]